MAINLWRVGQGCGQMSHGRRYDTAWQWEGGWLIGWWFVHTRVNSELRGGQKVVDLLIPVFGLASVHFSQFLNNCIATLKAKGPLKWLKVVFSCSSLHLSQILAKASNIMMDNSMSAATLQLLQCPAWVQSDWVLHVQFLVCWGPLVCLLGGEY